MEAENNIQVFNNDQFGSVRTVIKDGEPWFVAADVCKALEIDATATRRLDEDEKSALRLTQTSSNGTEQGRDVTVISESGLYALVLGSRKPEAKAFKRWVTHDVIPAIRKTGGYIADPEKFINEYFSALSEDTKRGFALDMYRETKRLGEQNRQLTATIEEQRPHVEFANQVTASEDAIDMGLYSKTIQKFGVTIGRNTLFRKLRECGVLMADNTPYQRFLNSGWFKVIEYTYEVGGVPRLGTKTLVTGKGQVKIAELVRNNFTFKEAC